MTTRSASPGPASRRWCLQPLLTAPVVLTWAAAAGCASPAWQPRDAGTDELAVYEATVRFIVQHYDPSAEAEGRLGAVCLVVGRRHHVAVRERERGEEWNPPAGLLRRLDGLVHPVVPVSECSWNRNLREIHRPSGRPGLVLALSHPVWEGQSASRVDVQSRESDVYAFRYRCRLLWRVDEWEVEECLAPGDDG